LRFKTGTGVEFGSVSPKIGVLVAFVKSAEKLLSLDGPLAGRCAEDAGARALYCS